MKFSELVKQASDFLHSAGRVSYRALKREFELTDDDIEDLKEELIYAKRLAVDEDQRVLVWTGNETSEETPSQAAAAPALEPPPSTSLLQPEQETPAGERRQLTVMFCDLVGSTALSEQLDPEELQTVVRTYQEVSAQVIERYEGYIAQYLGNGLLVYFGYPAAHEDDAARAIRSGLEIVTALEQARGQFPQPVQVRIGIHTGPVVVGQMGGGSRHEQLALGETPNIAARVQGKAEPDEVVISAATEQLVTGLFEAEDRGRHKLKGISTPQPLYRVTAESSIRSRFEVAVQAGLTPLVGREHELGALQERWTQAQAGNGQVVLLSGEPGIGKSRLVQELKSQVTTEGAIPIAFRCSPYHQNSALYPITEHLQRLLQFTPDDMPETRLDKLQQTLGRYRFPQADTLPLLAALLSLPHPEDVVPLTMNPQQQKDQTQVALVTWFLEETEHRPVYTSWEDLHWADPSTLEVLDLLLNQVPTTRLLAVLTFRPEFVPLWGSRSCLSQLPLSRLGQSQVSAMVERVTMGRALPGEVVEQIAEKTDGVPLFVEELTKMIVESGVVRAVNHHYELTRPLATLTIPSTLQDSLMERLDRLGAAKEVAQLGATIGRAFSQALLQAVSPMEEAVLQHGLQQLVEAELVYQRGLPPQAYYTFKHALIQETAYHGLLKRTRQHYHQQIAQVLEGLLLETVDSQPELVAYHYTEAGLVEQAVPYWLQAGQQATQHSANTEAARHLTRGLELLQTLPDTPERALQEFDLLVALGGVLMTTKGYGAVEVEQTYSRALELCRQFGETPKIFPVLWGLWMFHNVKANHRAARELADQLLRLAQHVQDPVLLLEAHHVHWTNALFSTGEVLTAQKNTEQGLTLYEAQQHHGLTFLYGGHDPGVCGRGFSAMALWCLGYPNQARLRVQEALALAHKLSHPQSLALALTHAAWVGLHRREGRAIYEWATQLVTLSQEQQFPHWLAWGEVYQGAALAVQGYGAESTKQIGQGMATFRAVGAELHQPFFLALLATANSAMAQAERGLTLSTEALSIIGKIDEREYEIELYRLRGELLLGQSPEAGAEEAEACFYRAIEMARQQEAKSWELRAATSLARLWQRRGKPAEARELLTPIHNWFTEGFDTADLKDAKALLVALR